MSHVSFQFHATHAILSFICLIVFLDFILETRFSKYPKSYRKNLLFLTRIGAFWAALTFFQQLPVFTEMKLFVFYLTPLLWIQSGYAILRMVSVICMEKLSRFWKYWNMLGVFGAALGYVFNAFYNDIQLTWYGYSALSNFNVLALTLLFILVPHFQSLRILSRHAFKKNPIFSSILFKLFLTICLAIFISFTLDILLPIQSIYIYAESTLLMFTLITFVIQRTVYRIHRFSIDVQQASALIIDQLDEGVLLLNEKGQVIQYNPSALKLLSLKNNSILGKSILQLLPEITELVEISGKPVRIQNRKEKIMTAVSIFPQKLSGIVRGYLVVIRNISQETELTKNYQILQNQLKLELYSHKSEIVRIRKSLEEQKSYLSALLNNLPFRLSAKNKYGVYTKQNQLDVDNAGNRMGETDNEWTPEEKRALKGETQLFYTEMNKGLSNPHFFRNIIIPLYTNNILEGILKITEDITAQKMLENERDQLRKELFIALKQEEMNNIASGIAHDFNNILGSQIGFCELALETIPDSVQGKKYITEILNSSNRAKKIINELISIKTHRGKKLEIFSVEPVIDDAISLISMSLTPEIQIQKEIRVSGLQVFGDSLDLHRALVNLGVNGIYAMKKNGGLLKFIVNSIFIEKPFSVNMTQISSGYYMQIQVEDSGEGIAPDVLLRLFTPFFTTKAPNEGHGLGLSVTQALIQNAGGYLTVETAIGKGSTFTIYWPLKRKSLNQGSSDA